MMSDRSVSEVLREYLNAHVGEQIPLDTLNEICGNAGLHHWDRVARSLEQNEGYIISRKRGKWIRLDTLDRKAVAAKRGYISKKLRYEVFHRDNFECQGCGRRAGNGVELSPDHIVPVEWGGETTLENLQALCRVCNEGKQAWVQSEDKEIMSEVMKQSSAEGRLKVYFENYPNIEITVDRLAVIAKTRSWERALRRLRADYHMKVVPKRKNKSEGRLVDAYIYERED